MTADRPEAPKLRSLIEQGARLGLPAIVLYEWWRGPRTASELAVQEDLFPSEDCFPFDHRAAHVAAELYLRLGRPRPRQFDLAIAATALIAGGSLWTLNPSDFEDIPGLDLA
ncbi:MAG: type II toxin-antitoxin system VapC family toxin [bacterium]|nr:type II toxin-antitoxin system VapC family toxin [bacterium]